MAIQNAIASVAVRDVKAAEQWYERVFTRSADSRPMPEVVEWKFERGGWLQVYQLPERAGKGSVTFAVNSIDEQMALLRNIGIDPGKLMDGGKAKVVMIKDPDGNSLAFAEATDRTMAH